MIYSFVNLVSWNYFKKLRVNHNVYLDSISIKYLVTFLGGKLNEKQILAGVVFYNQHRSRLSEGILLGSKYVDGFKEFYSLPYWENEKDVGLNKKILDKVGKHRLIILGISSPKQEILATQLQNKLGPDVNIYCLGAAVSTNFNNKSFNYWWLRFLLKDFKRTYNKIKITIFEILKILLHKHKRKEFQAFCTHYLE